MPFSVYAFYDENWGRWDTPAGYFKVAAAGRFTIIYGATVYVDDLSYYVLTNPVSYLYQFIRTTESNGTPLVSVRAIGHAVLPNRIIITEFKIRASLAYDVWGNRVAPPTVGNKFQYCTIC